MKKSFAYIFYLPLLALAQNWQPVVTGSTYNYSPRVSNYITHVIFIESASNGVNYLNTITKICDTCVNAHLANQLYDTSYVIAGQPQFLQRKFSSVADGIYYFHDPRAVMLYTKDTIGQTRLFDSSQHIISTLLKRRDTVIFSQPDSVQLFKLSSGDTVILSKSHGFLYFPNSYGNQNGYTLKGIENASVQGDKFPAFPDFFNFNTGNIFQYATAYDQYFFFPPVLKQGIKKITILSKQVLQDTFVYSARVQTLDSAWVAGNPATYFYKDTIEIIRYIDSLAHFTNAYPAQKLIVNSYYPYHYDTTNIINQLAVSKDTQSLYVKSFGNACYSAAHTVFPYSYAAPLDTINPLLYLISSETMAGMEAKEGLGITSNTYYTNDMYVAQCLTAYVKENDTTGLIYPDTQLSAIAKKQNEVSNISIYPNPAKDLLYIHTDSETPAVSEIYDNLGRTIVSQQLTHTSNQIDVSSLQNGIYLIKISNKQHSISKKIIIE